MTKGLKSASGTDTNKAKIGGVTELYGDPNVKIEKPYTIILGPGFDVEISRTTDGEYWIHVATRQDTPDAPKAKIVDARVDARGDQTELVNRALKLALRDKNVNHIAFRVTLC